MRGRDLNKYQYHDPPQNSGSIKRLQNKLFRLSQSRSSVLFNKVQAIVQFRVGVSRAFLGAGETDEDQGRWDILGSTMSYTAL